MKELVETIQEAIKERLRCPFTSVFMLSFLAFNWRILLSIFFVATPKGTSITDSVTERIGLVEGMEVQYLWPIGFSVAYVAVTPWIHWGVEFGQSFARMRHKKLRINEDKEIDIARIEAEKETEKLRIEARRLRAERLEIDQESAEALLSGLEDRMSKLQATQVRLEELDLGIKAEQWAEQIRALKEDVRSLDGEIAVRAASGFNPKSLDIKLRKAIRDAGSAQFENWVTQENRGPGTVEYLVLSALPRLPWSDATDAQKIQSAAIKLSPEEWGSQFDRSLGDAKETHAAEIFEMCDRLVNSKALPD